MHSHMQQIIMCILYRPGIGPGTGVIKAVITDNIIIRNMLESISDKDGRGRNENGAEWMVKKFSFK